MWLVTLPARGSCFGEIKWRAAIIVEDVM